MYFHYEADRPYKWKRTEEALGSWRVKEGSTGRGFLATRTIAGYLALFLAFIYFLTSWEIASILFPFPAFLYCLSFCVRKERTVFFSLASSFFGAVSILVMLGFLAEYV